MSKYDLEGKTIPCAVVADLLPLYIDGVTGEETTHLVRRHLEGCSKCRARYEAMTSPIPAETQTAEVPKIDYLKLIRRRQQRRILYAILSAVICGVLGVLVNMFYVGKPVTDYVLDGQMLTTEGGLWVEGTLDEDQALCRWTMDEDGTVTFYAAPRLPWTGSHFSVALPAVEEGGHWRFARIVVEQNGAAWPERLQELLDVRNPYVGDIAADLRVAQLLGVAEQMGSFTNQLETTAAPYRWTLIFEEPLRWEELEQDRLLLRYAALMLGLIDNLDEVTFFSFADGESVTYTTADCDELLGLSVKASVQSLGELSRMLERLNVAVFP